VRLFIELADRVAYRQGVPPRTCCEKQTRPARLPPASLTPDNASGSRVSFQTGCGRPSCRNDDRLYATLRSFVVTTPSDSRCRGRRVNKAPHSSVDGNCNFLTVVVTASTCRGYRQGVESLRLTWRTVWMRGLSTCGSIYAGGTRRF